MEKYQHIDRVRGEFVALMDAISGLDERAMTVPAVGEWGLREVLAHIAGWTRIDTTIMRRLARGETPLPGDEEYGTGEGRNPGFAKDAAGKPVAAVVNDLHSAFGEFLAAAESVPEERFARGRTAHRVMEESAFAHIKEHRIEIESYRAKLRTTVQTVRVPDSELR